MKLISWNVNGLRAIMNKGFLDNFKQINADIFCIQETKLQEGQIDFNPEGYNVYWNSAIKKGYSGTAVFSKIKPIKVEYGIGQEEHDQEGRVITLEFKEFYLVNCYTPNSQRELTRLDYRMKWEDEFKSYLKKLDAKKPVILCGDTKDVYSWWSYMFHAREKNAGWRIDYFIVSEKIKEKIEDSKVLMQVLGSDHCPVELDIKI